MCFLLLKVSYLIQAAHSLWSPTKPTGCANLVVFLLLTPTLSYDTYLRAFFCIVTSLAWSWSPLSLVPTWNISELWTLHSCLHPCRKYRCETWAIKKAEHQKTDAFKLWCWRGLFRVPWSAKRSNQSILKEVNPEYSLEGLTLKLKLQCFGHVMQRADLLEKTLMLGKTEGKRRKGTTEDEIVR